MLGDGLIDVRHPAIMLLKNEIHNYLIYRVFNSRCEMRLKKIKSAVSIG